jgi:tetratricopeptide (TPR) repeat protein
MSLLLEALKRAEKAKEEAQRRASAQAARDQEAPRGADEPPPGTENKRVLTRDKLPDISQPLEILSDDLGQAAAATDPGAASAARPEPRATPAPRTSGARPDAGVAARSSRATAKLVFEAKLREPNPRLPFYAALATLGVFALGTAVYFWYQLQPPPALVNSNPARPANEKVVALAETPPPAPAAAQPPAIRGLPTAGAAPTPPRPAPAATPPAPERQLAPRGVSPVARAERAATPSIRRAPAPAAATARSDTGANVVATRSAPVQGVHPEVEAGYAAYQAGDLVRAREAYRKALAEEPANRDALLGLAAVELRSQRPELAEALYARVLQADPRDAHARAGMLNLRGAQQDPVLAESRLKSLLATNPDAHVLHYTLGHQYAQQERWAEAQQAYFRAFAADPENPDFAYSLAVSLDHLRQPRLALEYYQRATALAGRRSASFERAAVERRVQELAR